MLTTDSRSQKGCWTCRARRKKCDERAQPTCYTCESLQLTCHGYGPRPDWMDGGSREKAQVSEFKNAVKLSSKFRKRSRTLSNNERTLNIMRQRSNPFIDSRNSEYDSSYVLEVNGSPPAAPIPAGNHYPYALLSVMPLNNTFSNMEMDVLEDRLSQDLYSPDLMDFNTSHNIFWATGKNQATIESHSVFEELPNAGTDYRMGYISHSSSVSNESTPISDFSHDSSAKPSTITGPVVFNEQLKTLPIHELSAIRFYFETLIPAQFPFLEASAMHDFCRQLLELAGSSKVCLSAIIGQGLYGQQSELSKFGSDSNACLRRSAETYEATSLKGLHELLANRDWITRDNTESCDEFKLVEMMVCTTQIIQSMIARKDDAWTQVLQIAASFQPIDFDKLRNQKLQSLWRFQTIIICIDILACITTSSEPNFAIKFRDEFSDSRLRCDEVIGCDSSVIECIMNIAELQGWKNQETSNESISVIELARRALKIELCLQDARQRNLEKIQSHSILMSSVKDVWIITNVFASAASVYLHAAVSGCRPEVPEIKSGVADTVDAIKLLPRVGLVKRLMWPLCIAACLADGEHREFFEQLERGLAEELGTSQNILRALRIGKECWKLRKCNTSRRKIYDWTDAMASLENLVPLIF